MASVKFITEELLKRSNVYTSYYIKYDTLTLTGICCIIVTI